MLAAACILAATSATSATFAVPAAMAQTERVSAIVLVDSIGDVWKAGGGEDLGTLVGEKPTVDISTARIGHRSHQVRVRLSLVDLRKRPTPQTVQVEIRTPDRFVAFLTMGPGQRAGTHRLMRDGYHPATCGGLTHLVSYADDVVALRIPRGCLDQPSFVRVRIYVDLYKPGTSDTLPYSFWDNPHNDRLGAPFTQRLYRG
jgi:hypothetical protein